MVLIIDRGSTNKKFYTIGFGVDFDTLIFSERIWISGVKPEIMSAIDMLITNSINLKFCVLYLKHPLLMEQCKEENLSFFKDGQAKNILREYFAVRLIHRRFPVELIEIGKRLFI